MPPNATTENCLCDSFSHMRNLFTNKSFNLFPFVRSFIRSHSICMSKFRAETDFFCFSPNPIVLNSFLMRRKSLSRFDCESINHFCISHKTKHIFATVCDQLPLPRFDHFVVVCAVEFLAMSFNCDHSPIRPQLKPKCKPFRRAFSCSTNKHQFNYTFSSFLSQFFFLFFFCSRLLVVHFRFGFFHSRFNMEPLILCCEEK